MIARVAKAMNEKEKGFTLIELLVVIIIIGILAAIAIPVFMNQRQRAVDSGIKSDLRSIANEIESYYADAQEYPADGTITLTGPVVVPAFSSTGTDATIAISDDDTTFTYSNDGQSYTLTGVNTERGTGTTYTYDSAAGGLQN